MVSFLPHDAKKFFSWNAYTRDGTDVPPPNAYDGIVGPRGEKFNDMRQNKPFNPPGRSGRWKRIICLGSVILVTILVIGLAIGLGVGLTRNKGARYCLPIFFCRYLLREPRLCIYHTVRHGHRIALSCSVSKSLETRLL